jgi:hypothetical protein
LPQTLSDAHAILQYGMDAEAAGLLDQAADLLLGWATAQSIDLVEAKKLQLPGTNANGDPYSPLIYME